MDLYGLWPLNSGFSNDYRSDFDPTITNEFATAAFRVGHTLIPSLIHTLFRGGSRGRNLLRDMFNNINTLRNREGIDALLRGLTQTPVEQADDNFSDEVRPRERTATTTSLNHLLLVSRSPTSCSTPR